MRMLKVKKRTGIFADADIDAVVIGASDTCIIDRRPSKEDIKQTDFKSAGISPGSAKQ